MIRILLVPLFLYKVLRGEFGFAAAVYLTAAVTDGLDGAIARIWNMQTRLGTFLDPMADKLLVTTSYVSLGFLNIIPLWLAIAVISRDVIIVAGTFAVFFLKDQLIIRPHPVSKVTTFFQFMTVLWALVLSSQMVMADLPGVIKSYEYLIWVTGFLTVISGGIYILAGFRSLEE
jgi:cardiolipin synthase